LHAQLGTTVVKVIISLAIVYSGFAISFVLNG